MICTLFLAALPAPQGASEISRPGLDAAARGLEWLAAQQLPDGSWAADVGFKLEEGYRVWNPGAGHVGVTALAGMAFLAGGHVPGRGPYADVVERATNWILGQVRDDGYITANETRMYSHAFATLFLAEIHGMDPREEVRPVLQKAVDLIVAGQNTQGGWRYQPHVADSDMSVAACQVMALRAARNIGVQVPMGTVDAAIRYVRDSAVRDSNLDNQRRHNPAGSFRYQPDPFARSSFALTAAGITILHNSGLYADEDIDKGMEVLEESHESFNARYGIRSRGHYYFWYGHYYAVQAFHMAGGTRFRGYLKRVETTLLSLQFDDGSWPNEVGPGRAYGTATACLILQIPMEYLPIFQR